MASDLEDRFQEKKRKAYVSRRALTDYGMGIIYAGMGGFFILSKQLGITIDFPPEPFSYFFGGLCLLYGGFRIYRGYQKKYFQD